MNLIIYFFFFIPFSCLIDFYIIKILKGKKSYNFR